MTPDRADVVIVGAGILGSAVAAHLLERSAGRVVLLDSGDPASGTSGAGAGFVGAWAAGYAHFWDAQELELEQYGIHYYQQLSRERPEIECRANGNLYLATTDDGLERWISPICQHELAPVGTQELGPGDVAALTRGAIPAQSVAGGAFHPDGIQISAGRATRALARRVVANGGELRANTRATGLLIEGDRVVGVRTEAGDVKAGQTVLACGVWLNKILAEVAMQLPLLRIVATRVISPPSAVPDTIPTVMVPDLFGLWLREHRGGLTWGNGDGYAPLYEIGAGPGDGGQPRREELVTRLDGALSSRLRRLVPEHDTSIGWWLQGFPCMTPDRRFFAGAVAGLERLYVLGGDNEAGVTHGPGLGRLLAEIMADGASRWMDGDRYRIDRFPPDAFAGEAEIAAAMPARR